jgi:hypothetical protein
MMTYARSVEMVGNFCVVMYAQELFTKVTFDFTLDIAIITLM